LKSRIAAWVVALAALPLCVEAADLSGTYVLRPARVWTEGEPLHAGWVVVVQGNHIVGVGPEKPAPSGAQVIDLPDTTLLPGLMDAHSHLFLHPYNETSWNDQVLKEPVAYRTLRAGEQAKATLLSGFTTLRDLGTEGADFADVGLKRAIEDGLIPGPRLLPLARTVRRLVACGLTSAVRPRGRRRRVVCPTSSALRASRRGAAQIGSRCMRTIAGGLMEARSLPSARRSSRRS
jgi:imidazolonepropionase-like amidohydrolase